MDTRPISRILVVAFVAVLTLVPWVPGAQADVYWANVSDNSIGRANLDGTNPNRGFITGANRPFGLAVDASHIYWGNDGGNSIGRANLDGTNPDENFITGVSHPYALAVDGGHIYWTNSTGAGSSAIGRANLDGSGVTVPFISIGSNVAYGVAVDSSHIYWGVHDSNSIGRANLDGSSVDQTWKPAASAEGVAVDASHIYWANYGNDSIGRMNLDGSNPDPNFIPTVGVNGVALDGSHVYWTDFNGGNNGNGTGLEIGRAGLDGTSSNLTFINSALSPFGIAIDSGTGPSTLSPPTISGAAIEGHVLTEMHGSWANAPTRFTYQWLHCDGAGANCAAIAGAAGPSYTLSAADVGFTIRVQEGASNSFGSSSGIGTSTATDVVHPIPASTAPPTINGPAVQARTLTEVHGSWTANPTSFSYQWLRCDSLGTNCTAIPGAIGQSFVLTAAEVGATVRVQEVASNLYGASSAATSAATNLVASSPPVDADGDGYAAGVDCDDHNKAIHPGAVDIPQNGIDENCDRVDAPFPRLSVGLTINADAGFPSGVRITRLLLAPLPAHAKIEVRCKGGGCPKHRVIRVRKAKAHLSLLKYFKGRTLHAKARVDLLITKSRTVGNDWRIVVKRKSLSAGRLCLSPGKNTVTRCS